MFVGLFCSALYPLFPFSYFFPSLFLSPDGVVGHWPLLSSFLLPSFCLSFFPGGVDWALFCSVLSCSVPAVPFPLFVCFHSVVLPRGWLVLFGSVLDLSSFSSFLFHTRALVVVGCIPPCVQSYVLGGGMLPRVFHLL